MAAAVQTVLFENDRTQNLAVTEQAVFQSTATDPTTSYATFGADYAVCDRARKVSLFFGVTWVDATSFEYYIEWGRSTTVFARSVSQATAAGVITLTRNNAAIGVSATLLDWIDTFDVQAPYYRVVVKRTGGAVTNKLTLHALHIW